MKFYKEKFINTHESIHFSPVLTGFWRNWTAGVFRTCGIKNIIKSKANGELDYTSFISFLYYEPLIVRDLRAVYG